MSHVITTKMNKIFAQKLKYFNASRQFSSMQALAEKN